MTLIEVMISVLVLGVVLVGLAQGIVLGIRLNSDAKTRVASINLSKRIAEKLKSDVQYHHATFDNANTNPAFNTSYYVDLDGNKLAQNEHALAAFQATTTITDWTNSSGNTLSSGGNVMVKKLVVTVHPLQLAVSNQATVSRISHDAVMTVEIVRPAN
jgi:Tfp pilus assembly protein PilV